MSHLLLLTNSNEPSDHVLPALGLLLHSVRVAPAEAGALLSTGADRSSSMPVDAILVDARTDLATVRNFCRLLDTTGLDCPLLAVLTEGGVAALTPDWQIDDFLLTSAGPAEVEARLRLAIGQADSGADDPDEIRRGDLVIDEATYIARLRGRILDLTFKEFELLKFLAQHPGRVFTRAQLLQEVWGYDYFGGTRTIDVHVRRLRAKLGSEYESLIGTVRNVGYRFVPDPATKAADPSAQRDGRTEDSPHTAPASG
ncbi:winged-helix domain-containing protein [Streptomonospora nanhaiensis]|uniref:DNA-binding response OmpR family regulator n=1 Tax=Streptomonospora nanhaiensis TaxID=1323731 RepID=A0A853BQA9_9ACTN|nr:response regulator transcription factor [Streptomonospora nanhaiensis]MBV2365962.1 response regulator transcription factor [Streptomonospora nanhaiensis]MBX9388860.1 response regulator transcription factor [Streptomonospora nanhaiensis]NYI96602.1 DNA-binding response OmpR family regulator [Streptomonospora nanhaiensis]